MILLSGPRQIGKTFMAKALMKEFQRPQSLNYDNLDDALIIRRLSWAENFDLLILDEILKMREWKSFLKGIADSRRPGQAILVAGSARLDTFCPSGESLAGHYLPFHLHPLSV